MLTTTDDIGSGSAEANKSKCKRCGGEFDKFGHHTCAMCGCFDCGLEEDDFSCAECEAFYTEHHSGVAELQQVICNECGEIYREECAQFKVGAGDKRCYECQSHWRRIKPANAFGKECGSQRQDTIICKHCNERLCCECERLFCDGYEKYLCFMDCERLGMMEFREKRDQYLQLHVSVVPPVITRIRGKQ